MAAPILTTDRMLLVPLADRHLGLEIELDSDPEVLRFLFGRPRPADEVRRAHAERMELGRRVDGLGYWVAFGVDGGARGSRAPAAEEDGEFLGLMMLPPAHGPDQPDDPTVGELGYRFRRQVWRRGLATEASRRLLAHAFDTVGQSRVLAQTMAVNAGSRAVMAALGMRHTRTFYPSFEDPLPGADQGEVEYEMTAVEWRARNRPGDESR
ncbi:GNAT family N-acetyltransferase [Calidifontibacter sp. DB0510]|uniref:GNAT family N-acetyltransferase n=1 Tax=Metallococcus carri TaxID=1656884 RepID=A0A967AXB7_9MICO|nr:GNAT family N-acetyltransferase [Metallococcus carri]NHN54719.1 GNAT family N-acetyltransferase [Metallococcus carri]NOP37064.1 GNAT family N-acetyltransferase [Calidifontibacter sp. DB2511S]